MTCLVKNSILDLPNEIIENVLSFVSWSDLINLSNTGRRLKKLTDRIAKHRPFGEYVIYFTNQSFEYVYKSIYFQLNETLSLAPTFISKFFQTLPSLADTLMIV